MQVHFKEAGHGGYKKKHCKTLAGLKSGTEEWALYRKAVQNTVHERNTIDSQGFQCSTCGVFQQEFSAMKAHWTQSRLTRHPSKACVKETRKQCSLYMQLRAAQSQPGHAIASSHDASGDYDDDDDNCDDDDDDDGDIDYIDDDTWMRGRGDVPESYWR
jgi:hypothetical protein